MCNESRPLTQNEIDGFWRNDWIQKILNWIGSSSEINDDGNVTVTCGRPARFVVRRNKTCLIEIRQIGSLAGEWTIECAGEVKYTYHFSHVINFLEDLFDRRFEVIELEGEINGIKPNYLEAREE